MTAANLGDSRAIIDTGVELHHLTGARHAARMGLYCSFGGPEVQPALLAPKLPVGSLGQSSIRACLTQTVEACAWENNGINCT